MSELGELRASLVRAQQELDAANDRLDAMENATSHPTATVLTPRGADRQKKKLILVGALSSLGTAVLLGLFSLLAAPSAKPVHVTELPPPPPAPVSVVPPPPATTVAVVEPPPPPPVVEPVTPPPAPMAPRPTRVARANPNSDAPARARNEDSDMGSLTVVCLPVKCDSITDNGVDLGPGHIFARPATAGRHRLTLHSPNGVTKHLSVEVRPDQLKDIRVQMQDASDVF